MSNDIRVIKKEINYFMLINFGLIAFVSIFIFLVASKPNGSEFIANFAVLFMYIPAFSVIVVLKKISNYEFNQTVDKFFKVFAITTVVRIVISIIEVFFIHSIFISSIIDTIASIYLLGLVLYNESAFEVLNLSLTKNFKKILGVMGIFIAISIIRTVISEIYSETGSVDYIGNFSIALLSIIMNFCLGFNLFFGEEFGWRYFLQPRLQKLYGNRCGVFILGFIWGIWHLPLCFTLYSPQTPIYCVISHISYCMLLGVFLGYAYMKTQSVWAPILIHLVNNSIAVILGGGYESVITLEILLVSTVVNALVFLPFLLTKEYKVNKIEKKSSLDV